MPVLSEDQVNALAPDPNSAKAGLELANQRKWVSFGTDTNFVWGECQGSGRFPYQTIVDATELAFKCSCPSRKFPCKHGLGLLFLRARQPEVFASSQTPDWVKTWSDARQSRAEKKTAKKESSLPPDPVAKSKRQAERLAKVEAGLGEFRLWMQDRIRQGLAGLETQSYQYWENTAARLTDAQAPGLARMLRQCAGIPSSGEGWQERLLKRLSLIYLAAEGFSRIDELPADLQQDLRNIIGFTTSQDEVLQSTGIQDRWQILGQRIDGEDRLRVQRTWLRGEQSGRWALILAFAHGMQAFDQNFVPSQILNAELCFFPSGYPLRALVKTRVESNATIKSMNAYSSSSEFLDEFSRALAQNPWTDAIPVAISGLQANMQPDGQLVLVDAEKNVLPLSITGGVEWQMLALTGGHSFSIFGEWNGESLLPLSILCREKFYRLDLLRVAADVT